VAPVSRTQDEGTATRLQQAAWSVVRDEGIAAATSRRITEVASANLAAITYHYGSKDELIGAAVVEQLRSWTEPLTTALRAHADDVEAHDARIAVVVAEVLGRFVSDRRDIDAIVTLVLTSPNLPGVREAAATWMRELRAVATAVMQEQQEAGLIPDTVMPAALAAVFTAFALGLVAQDAIDPTAPAVGTVVSEFLGLLVRPPR
jgi:AcrR family transcriptional regulator